MRRFIRSLLAALAVAAILVSSASASAGALPYPHPRDNQAATGDTHDSNVAIAVVLAGACLLLGAATVRPRRHRVVV